MGTVASSKIPPKRAPKGRIANTVTVQGGGGLLFRSCPNTWLVPLLAKTTQESLRRIWEAAVMG